MSAGSRGRANAGFTLTEMLVTTLILVLASTLMATGIPVAADTYQKTVRSANAQVALATTVTVLRNELGAASEITQLGDDVYYFSGEGYWARIRNAETDEGYRGLVRQYYALRDDVVVPNSSDDFVELTDGTGSPLATPVVSNAAITEDLTITLGSMRHDPADNPRIRVENLVVEDAAGNRLAGVGDGGNPYVILNHFI